MSNTHADTVLYVRDTMLEQQEPPITSVGAIGWARGNLFNGWANTVLTVLSLAFIFYLLSHLLPWFISPTWGGTSLTNCREILAEGVREGGGACWGVIRERWPQLLFGFYPSELYWRPILALVLLMAALGPVLFTDFVPPKYLPYAALYPFIMPWLLWGGTVWTPVMALLGIGVALVAYKLLCRVVPAGLAVILAALAAVIWWLFLSGAIAGAFASVLPLALEPVASRQFGGFMLSVTIGVTAIGVSLPIGIMLALGRQSDLPFVKWVCICFIEFIRGVPLITLLFVASVLLNIFLPPGTNFDIILRVIIMTTLFASAYMAEVIRGGLAALPKGQYEGGDSLGLDY